MTTFHKVLAGITGVGMLLMLISQLIYAPSFPFVGSFLIGLGIATFFDERGRTARQRAAQNDPMLPQE
ncbi:MAG: hypothetical protein JWS12_295 [Candidatus Saccharibacteria bacterium]|nr:hypothetical protein [Candidatus Saccharibacteria bacterium]